MSDEVAHLMTRLLGDVQRGDAAARQRFFELVHDELRRVAAAYLRRERPGHTLQPTALVNEAYLRLFGPSPSALPPGTGRLADGDQGESPLPHERGSVQGGSNHPDRPAGTPDATMDSPTATVAGSHFENRRQFFAAAANAMRQILVDGARKRGRKKRGDGRPVTPLAVDPADSGAGDDPEKLLALDEALSRFTAEHPREAQVVELRYFAGLTVEDAAVVLGVATRTVEKDWAFARAWLRRALS